MNTALLQRPLLCQFPAIFYENIAGNSFVNTRSSSFQCRSIKNEEKTEPYQGFSVLTTDPQPQHDIGSILSSVGFYVFSIHVPLSFGGLSTAAKILNQPVLDPQTEAILILAIQTFELSIVLLLLSFPGKPQYDLQDFFQANKSLKQRSWLLASVLGFGVLLSLVFITSYFAERLMGPKDVNNPFLKEILSSGSNSVTASILANCIITPFLEEVVYRGFLVTSLASTMNWKLAVTISSIVFSASHFSGKSKRRDLTKLVPISYILCLLCFSVIMGLSYLFFAPHMFIMAPASSYEQYREHDEVKECDQFRASPSIIMHLQHHFMCSIGLYVTGLSSLDDVKTS